MSRFEPSNMLCLVLTLVVVGIGLQHADAAGTPVCTSSGFKQLSSDCPTLSLPLNRNEVDFVTEKFSDLFNGSQSFVGKQNVCAKHVKGTLPRKCTQATCKHLCVLDPTCVSIAFDDSDLCYTFDVLESSLYNPTDVKEAMGGSAQAKRIVRNADLWTCEERVTRSLLCIRRFQQGHGLCECVPKVVELLAVCSENSSVPSAGVQSFHCNMAQSTTPPSSFSTPGATDAPTPTRETNGFNGTHVEVSGGAGGPDVTLILACAVCFAVGGTFVTANRVAKRRLTRTTSDDDVARSPKTAANYARRLTGTTLETVVEKSELPDEQHKALGRNSEFRHTLFVCLFVYLFGWLELPPGQQVDVLAPLTNE
jgi:hypothetical protein